MVEEEEEEERSSELYEGKVVLQVAPGVVLLQVRALKGEGAGREVGNTRKEENKTGDGIAFLFRDRSGGGGSLSLCVTGLRQRSRWGNGA